MLQCNNFGPRPLLRIQDTACDTQLLQPVLADAPSASVTMLPSSLVNLRRPSDAAAYGMPGGTSSSRSVEQGPVSAMSFEHWQRHFILVLRHGFSQMLVHQSRTMSKSPSSQVQVRGASFFLHYSYTRHTHHLPTCTLYKLKYRSLSADRHPELRNNGKACTIQKQTEKHSTSCSEKTHPASSSAALSSAQSN